MITDIKIDFHCKVNRSGYKLIKRGEATKPNNQWTLNPVGTIEKEYITPHSEDAEMMEVVYNINIFTDFRKLMKLNERGNLKNSEVIIFCKNYGLTQNAKSEGLEDFREFLDFMQIQEKRRSSGELIQIERQYLPQISFGIWEGGKIHPTYKPINLREAIYLTWIFSSHTSTLRKCKYYSDYGSREGCFQVFEPKRGDAEFCSNGGKCRAAWHQKRTYQ